MSIVFGVVNKTSKYDVNHAAIADSINDLTLNGRRSVEKNEYKNIIFYSIATGKKNTTVVNEDNTICLIMSGNIYGYTQKYKNIIVKKHNVNDLNNPAEFLLHSYEEFGMNAFNDLNGNFAAAIRNDTNGSLIIVNDLFGFQPVFIYDSKEALIFCSEYQPILKYHNFCNNLNYEAIAEYFISGTTLNNKTFFKHINRLPPGTLLEYKNNKVRYKKYITLNNVIQSNKPISFFAEKLDHVFKKAVKLRVADFQSIKCSLTGGFDTRYIFSSMSPIERNNIPFHTYVHSSINEDKDVICAKIIANEYGLNHKIINSNFDGEFNEQIYEQNRPLIYPGAKHTIHGWLGGALLGGHLLKYYFSHNRYLVKGLCCNEIMLRKYFKKYFIKNITNLNDLNYYSQLHNKKSESINNRLSFCINLGARAFFTSIFGGATMGSLQPYSHFLEHKRYPFLDTDFLKTLLSVPHQYLKNYRLYFEIMKRYHNKLFTYPTASNTLFTDSRSKTMKKGTHVYHVRRKDYYNYLKLCLLNPTQWSKKNYSIYINTLLRSRSLINTIFNIHDIKDRNIFSIVKLLDFDNWLRKYYLNK